MMNKKRMDLHGVYSPSGMTYGIAADRRGDPSSLGFEDESSSAASVAPSSDVKSGLVLIFSVCKE